MGSAARGFRAFSPSKAIYCAAAACTASLLASHIAQANSGMQLPLSQYQAGSEITQSGNIINPGFEQPGFSGTVATGWQNLDDSGGAGTMRVDPPDPLHLPNPPSAIGSFSAKGVVPNVNFNQMYVQQITLQPNTDYVISGYIWNFALAGPNPPDDFNAGDLAVVQLRDTSNFFNTAGVILERTALDGGDSVNGYFVYKSFNSSQFPSGAQIEVLMDPNENISGSRPTVLGQFDNVALTPLTQFVSQKWISTGGGTWSDSSKWQNGSPNAKDAIASFLNTITTPSTITLDAPKTVAVINFDSSNSYTINGTATLTLNHEETGDAVLLNVLSGSHTISAPVKIGIVTTGSPPQLVTRNFRVAVDPASSVLTVSNDVVPASVGTLGTGTFNLIKNGAGRLDMKNVRAARLNLNTGTVGILTNGSNSGASQIGTLTVAGGATPTATLDLNDNDLIVRNTTYSDMTNLIRNARHGGAWDQPGVTSSAARTASPAIKTLGVLTGTQFQAAQGGTATFDNFAVANTDTLVKFTYYGDTDFNGKVDGADYARIDSTFNNEASQGNIGGWFNGDLDYNDKVDGADYALIDAAFNGQGGTVLRMLSFLDGSNTDRRTMNTPALAAVVSHFEQFGESYAMAALSTVPEPATLGVAGLAGVMMLRRQRSR